MTTADLEWTEEMSREYARYMEMNVKYDHREWAKMIAADWPQVPASASVVDVAGGPAFLLLEVAPLLKEPQLILTDGSPLMITIGQERAAPRHYEIEGHVCLAEQLALPDATADLVLCKHFLRFAQDLDQSLREMARVLKPGGRAYLIDFNGEGPWLGSLLLRLWIRCTAPTFISTNFARSMALGLPAASLPERIKAAGFSEAVVLYSGVSYLIRAVR